MHFTSTCDRKIGEKRSRDSRCSDNPPEKKFHMGGLLCLMMGLVLIGLWVLHGESRESALL